MTEKLKKFFLKNRIDEDKIMYIARKDSKTQIHMEDGRIITTYIPTKTITSEFGFENFLSINKGIVLNVNYILYVDQNKYTMKDCTEFEGRSRSTQSQKQIKHKLVKNPSHKDVHNIIQTRFSILDKCPVPFCVCEYINKDDVFIIRYTNRAIKNIASSCIHFVDIPLNDLIDLNDDIIKILKDVALNDTSRTIQYNGYTIECYSPLENYCSCAITKK